MKKDILDVKEILTLITQTNTCLNKLKSLLRSLDSMATISYDATRKPELLKEKIYEGDHSIRMNSMIKEQKMKTYVDLYRFMNEGRYRIVRNCGKKMEQEIERFFFSRGYFYQ